MPTIILTAQRRERLLQGFLDAYRLADELTRITRFALGVNLAEITLADDLTARTFALLEWAESKGRLVDLLRYAMKDASGNVQLVAVCREVLGETSPQAAPGVVDTAVILFDGRKSKKVVGAQLRLRDVFTEEEVTTTSGADGIARFCAARARVFQFDLRVPLADGARCATLPVLRIDALPSWSEIDISSVKSDEWSECGDGAHAHGLRFDTVTPTRSAGPHAPPAQVLGDASFLAIHLPWGTPTADILVSRAAYALGFDPRLRLPRWVAYRIQNTTSRARPAKMLFVVDPLLPADVQTPAEAYDGNPYDRGHLVRRLDVPASVEHEVSYLSAVVPQLDRVNQGVWMQLEQMASRVAQTHDVWIFAGPIFAPADDKGRVVRLAGRFEVPTHFFRIVVRRSRDGGPLGAMAHVVPNNADADRDPTPYLTTVEAIERTTGLRFFTEWIGEEERSTLLTATGW